MTTIWIVILCILGLCVLIAPFFLGDNREGLSK